MEPGNWILDPDTFLSGWKGEQEFEHVETPTPPSRSQSQDPSTQGLEDHVPGGQSEDALAHLISFIETELAASGFLYNDEISSLGSPVLPQQSLEEHTSFDSAEVKDSSGTITRGTKRPASEPTEAGLSDECSSPQRKKLCEDTTANHNTAAPPYVPGPTPNYNPVIHSNMLSSLGTFQEKQLYTCVAPASDPSAMSRRQQEDNPYIKKPPNAFMLFRAEQRPKVVQELQITDCAKVNVVLGRRWRKLSEQDQAPYFEQAHRERRAHEAKYPGWSTKENWGKKRKNNGLSVAATSQQPAMWPTTTHPVSFINQPMYNQPMYHQPLYHQAHGNQPMHHQAYGNQPMYSQALHNQAMYSHFLDNQASESQTLQNLPVETFVLEGNQMKGNQMKGIPLEAFLKQAHKNDVQVQVLQPQPEMSALDDRALLNQALSYQAPDKQATENQAMNIQTLNIQTLQDLSMETVMYEGLPMQGIPLEAFMKQACDNDVQVQVVQSESGTSASTTLNI